MAETWEHRMADRIWVFTLNNEDYGFEDILRIITEESAPVIDALKAENKRLKSIIAEAKRCGTSARALLEEVEREVNDG